MRKTINVASLIERVNARNRASTCSAAVREGWNSIAEEALAAADAYAGFHFLTEKEVPKGQEPGIRGTSPDAIFPDKTRREYIILPALRSKKP